MNYFAVMKCKLRMTTFVTFVTEDSVGEDTVQLYDLHAPNCLAVLQFCDFIY